MFDVAFSELLVIAIVALIVIGPEKLPGVARTLGALVGRMQRYVSTVKADVERELQAQDLHKIQAEVRQGIASIESGVTQEMHHVEDSVAEAAHVAESAGKNDSSAGSA
jgi:sec-independent protein translocase protein TatB